MKKFAHKVTLSAAGALLALAATSANALTITAGDYIFTIANFDSGSTGYGDSVGVKCTTVADCDTAIKATGTPALGSVKSVNTSADTMGIFSVTTIAKNGSLTPVFTAGGADGFLTGIFGNLTDYNVAVTNAPGSTAGNCSSANPGACVTTANAVGGTFSLFQNASAPNNVGPRTTANGGALGVDLNDGLYPMINTGSLYLKGVFSSGVIFNDPTTTYQSIFNNGTISGGGSGYLDLTGGSAFGTFHSQKQVDPNGGLHDLFANFTFGQNTSNDPSANNKFNVNSAGSITGAAPEPGTLALAALALLGIAGISRKKSV